MSFSSLDFIFLFLPVFLLIYYLAPSAVWNLVIAAAGLVFYTLGVGKHWWMTALLAGELVFTWLIGLVLERGKSRAVAAIAQAVLFGALFFFKYQNLAGLSIAFPLAISFYTFQMSAYLSDVRRGTVPAARNLIDYAAGVLLFVRLLSGPITSWKLITRDLKERHVSWNGITEGLRDFIIGLGLKLLLADSIAGVWRQIENIGMSSISTPMAWLGIAAYSLQLYFDFWGYSRMAIGLGRMLGFEIPVNFRWPYAARTMTEFWRRWHITLGAWFRDYIYIPLGGSRVNVPRHLFNLLAVWLFTGLWHGSTLNFLVWGLFLFVIIVLEKYVWGQFMEDSYILGHLYMILLIPLSWLIFAVPSLPGIWQYLTRLFGQSEGLLKYTQDFLPQIKTYWLFLALGVLFATPLPNRLYEKVRQSRLADLALFLLFWFCVYRMAIGLANPFQYFSF